MKKNRAEPHETARHVIGITGVTDSSTARVIDSVLERHDSDIDPEGDGIQDEFFAAWDELTRNGEDFVDWMYWCGLPAWTRNEAACLLFGVDADRWTNGNLGECPDEVEDKITKMMRLMERECPEKMSPQEWLAWAESKDTEPFYFCRTYISGSGQSEHEAAIPYKEQLRSLIEAASLRAKNAANVRHNKKGGSRGKRAEIRKIWKSGKYSSRDRCAEEECGALDMSFSAARKALRNVSRST
jgi:hypothetical protein